VKRQRELDAIKRKQLEEEKIAREELEKRIQAEKKRRDEEAMRIEIERKLLEEEKGAESKFLELVSHLREQESKEELPMVKLTRLRLLKPESPSHRFEIIGQCYQLCTVMGIIDPKTGKKIGCDCLHCVPRKLNELEELSIVTRYDTDGHVVKQIDTKVYSQILRNERFNDEVGAVWDGLNRRGKKRHTLDQVLDHMFRLDDGY